MRDLSTETTQSAGSLFEELAGALLTEEDDSASKAQLDPEDGGKGHRVHYETSVSFPVRQAIVQPESWTTVTRGNHVITWIVQSSNHLPGTAQGETAWIATYNETGGGVAVVADQPNLVGYHNNRWWSQVQLRAKYCAKLFSY